MKTRKLILASVVAICCIAWVSAYGGDEIKVNGFITGRTGDTMTLRTADGTNKTVALTDDTKVQQPKGLGLRKKQVSWTELIPGLRVEVKGNTNEQGQLVASVITFNKQDLQTASMIQAGLAPTQQQVQANQQDISSNKQAIGSNQQAIATNKQTIDANEQETDKRFASLADYEVKKTLTVNYAPGSSALAQKDKAALADLAKSTADAPGAIIQVKGFADSSGNAAMNQTLSRDRAESVIEYLMQDCNVAPRRIVAPGAMGISDPVASNETAAGRADNRRVEVKVLVNKGVAGGSTGQ
jgi:outer membrane protein OmpA-like peptidoglycan-associated protein